MGGGEESLGCRGEDDQEKNLKEKETEELGEELGRILKRGKAKTFLKL